MPRSGSGTSEGPDPEPQGSDPEPQGSDPEQRWSGSGTSDMPTTNTEQMVLTL